MMFTRHRLLHVWLLHTDGSQATLALPLYLVRGRDRLCVANDRRHCMMTLWLDPPSNELLISNF